MIVLSQTDTEVCTSRETFLNGNRPLSRNVDGPRYRSPVLIVVARLDRGRSWAYPVLSRAACPQFDRCTQRAGLAGHPHNHCGITAIVLPLAENVGCRVWQLASLWPLQDYTPNAQLLLLAKNVTCRFCGAVLDADVEVGFHLILAMKALNWRLVHSSRCWSVSCVSSLVARFALR